MSSFNMHYFLKYARYFIRMPLRYLFQNLAKNSKFTVLIIYYLESTTPLPINLEGNISGVFRHYLSWLSWDEIIFNPWNSISVLCNVREYNTISDFRAPFESVAACDPDEIGARYLCVVSSRHLSCARSWHLFGVLRCAVLSASDLLLAFHVFTERNPIFSHFKENVKNLTR